jgi:ABC-type multidrug transport system fused ATPase/permease subunit
VTRDQHKPVDFLSVLGYAMPGRGALLLLSGLLIANSLVMLAHPWLAGRLTAAVLSGDDAQVILLLWLALSLAGALLAWSCHSLTGVTGDRVANTLRHRLYRHMQALPLAWHRQGSRGDTLSLLYADSTAVSRFVTGALVQLAPSLLTFAAVLALMAWLDPVVTLLALVGVPLYLVMIKLSGRRLRPLSRAWIEANSRLYRVMDENLTMLPAIKGFAREALEMRRFEEAASEQLELARRQLLLQSALSPASSLLAALGLALVLWLGAVRVEAGLITAPELVTLLLYCMLLLRPLGSLASVYGQLQTARGASERIIAFFNAPPEPDDSGKPALVVPRGELRFCAVTFAYPDGPPVLRGLDLHIQPGETIAITGDNGAGKTTLIHLLLRFADPQRGRILVDGRDIREVARGSLRRQVALAGQELLLLNGSVAENIRYGRPEAGEAGIRAAAEAACAAGFIDALPNGYGTIIGDQGVRLSGGQRQRLALARALLVDPPILVMDEATAMFDPEGEASFLEHCRTTLRHRTVILITHRPASLALADRVLRLENGALVPQLPELLPSSHRTSERVGSA